MDQSIGRTADRLQHNLRIVESRGGEQFTWQWSSCNRDLRCAFSARFGQANRSEEHTSELQSLRHLVCRLLLEKKKKLSRPDVDSPWHSCPVSSDRSPGLD